MRLPRDLAGADLAKALGRLGYETTRQTGSHIRLTTQVEGEHHVTIPLQGPVKVGTLAAILNEVAHHAGVTRREVLARLFS